MTGPDQFATRRDVIRTEMGGRERVRRLARAGRPTIRDRISALLDPGTFDEVGTFARRTGPRTAATPRATGRSGATAGSTAGPSRSQATT